MDQSGEKHPVKHDSSEAVQRLFEEPVTQIETPVSEKASMPHQKMDESQIEDTEEVIEESLSLTDKEVELITRALKKHSGKRKLAAQELGISERTLYRKIKEYQIQE
jgi:transcriptional regulator with PAS, ATPase and Fis domain